METIKVKWKINQRNDESVLCLQTNRYICISLGLPALSLSLSPLPLPLPPSFGGLLLLLLLLCRSQIYETKWYDNGKPYFINGKLVCASLSFFIFHLILSPCAQRIQHFSFLCLSLGFFLSSIFVFVYFFLLISLILSFLIRFFVLLLDDSQKLWK